ncbi:hypothetical protein ACLOJK_004981 [Asimina triloba]
MATVPIDVCRRSLHPSPSIAPGPPASSIRDAANDSSAQTSLPPDDDIDAWII